jgi:hypothetical protein
VPEFPAPDKRKKAQFLRWAFLCLAAGYTVQAWFTVCDAGVKSLTAHTQPAGLI